MTPAIATVLKRIRWFNVVPLATTVREALYPLRRGNEREQMVWRSSTARSLVSMETIAQR